MLILDAVIFCDFRKTFATCLMMTSTTNLNLQNMWIFFSIQIQKLWSLKFFYRNSNKKQKKKIIQLQQMQIRLDTVHWSCQSCVISSNVTESYYVLMEVRIFFFDKWAWEIVNLIWSNIWKACCDKILVFLSYHRFMNWSKMSGLLCTLKKMCFFTNLKLV